MSKKKGSDKVVEEVAEEAVTTTDAETTEAVEETTEEVDMDEVLEAVPETSGSTPLQAYVREKIKNAKGA